MDLPLEVEEFMTWLATERGRAPTTLTAYRGDLTRYVTWLDEHDLTVGSAEPDDVARYIEYLRELGRAPSTVARATVAVRALHRFGAGEGLVDHDATDALDVPRVPRGAPRALSEDEVGALLASPVGDDPTARRDRAMLEVLYGQGLRISELTGLSLRDVDLDDRLLRVLGKGGRERIVPLGRHSATALGDWMSGAGRGAMEPATWRRRDDAEAVFLSHRGRRITRQGAWLIVRRHGDRVELGERLTPHVLRHSCATHMLDHGADVRTVQEFLGHASISSTQRYTAVSRLRLREAYDRAHPRARP